MGEIKGKWLSIEQKVDILLMTERAKNKGIAITRTSALLMIERRRVVRWRKKEKDGQSLENLKPGPQYPYHKLLTEEETAVLKWLRKKNTPTYPTAYWL